MYVCIGFFNYSVLCYTLIAKLYYICNQVNYIPLLDDKIFLAYRNIIDIIALQKY